VSDACTNPPKVIKTPFQSSHLNVIKNLWVKLETEIRNHTTSNKEGLKNRGNGNNQAQAH
jgi:hypothetical protein